VKVTGEAALTRWERTATDRWQGCWSARNVTAVKVNGYVIKPKADLSGADLAGADLAGARLGKANLEGANLEGANLSSAKLKKTKLEGANLASANLRFADLEEADLAGACLTDAALCGANLSFAWLHRANLTRADLTDALLRTTRLTEANLTGAVLTGPVFQPTFDNFIIAGETTVWPVGFDPEVAWARGAVIQTSEVLAPQEKEVVELAEDDDPGGVSGISRESLLKMEDYIRARNSTERLQLVELVAQYLMETEGDQGEDELTMSRYHLSTDRGTADLKRLYPDALAWAAGELEQGRYEFGRFFPDGSINLQDPLLADSYGQTVENLRRLFPADSGESAEGDVSGEAEEMRTESDDGGERVAGVVGEHGEPVVNRKAVFVDLVREMYGDSGAELAADMVDETDMGADLGPVVTEFIHKVHGLDHLIDELRGRGYGYLFPEGPDDPDKEEL